MVNGGPFSIKLHRCLISRTVCVCMCLCGYLYLCEDKIVNEKMKIISTWTKRANPEKNLLDHFSHFVLNSYHLHAAIIANDVTFLVCHNSYKN